MTHTFIIGADSFALADPEAGPELLRAAIAAAKLDLTVDLVQVGDNSWMLVGASTAPPEQPARLIRLCETMGPLLADAIEMRFVMPKFFENDDLEPMRLYAGPTAQAIHDRRLLRVQQMQAQTEAFVDQIYLDDLGEVAQGGDHPGEPAQATQRLRGRQARVSAVAARLLNGAGLTELAEAVQRTSRELATTEADWDQPRLQRNTYMVTVLGEGALEFGELSEIAAAIHTGDCTGSWELVSSEPLTRQAAIEAVRAVGSDPDFFQLGESGDDDEGATALPQEGVSAG